MIRRRLVLALIVVASAAAVLLGIALTAFKGEEDRQTVASINDARGMYRGVGVGDDAAAVRRVFGERPFARLNVDPVIPTNARIGETGGPAVIETPCKPTRRMRGGRSRLALLRYSDVSFLFCDGRVFAWMVIADDARTSRGLSVGDDLDKARNLYPGLTCGEAPSGDIGRYPYCAGAIASQRETPRLHLWFGEDPVASITISAARYDGYEK